jgi:hypothetical protein
MKSFRFPLVLVAALAVCLSQGIAPARAEGAVQQCTGTFTGNVTSGPDAGLQLKGSITLQVDSKGQIEGTLTQDGGPQSSVEGTFRAPTIRLTLVLSDNAAIRGVGELPGGFTPCTSNFGGDFRGPAPKDRGDWGIIWGS